MGKTSTCSARRLSVFALSTVTALSLAFPQAALAKVTVDQNELALGENSVGGGKATLSDTSLDMTGVTASGVRVDEDLAINFNGGNGVGVLDIEGSADVEVSFAGDNEVEDIHAHDGSSVIVNADGHNDFEEVEAFEDANITVNVTGENDFETIEGHGDANVTVRGTDCQRRDVANVGGGEKKAGVSAEGGNVRIDHVTVNLESETARVGSKTGDVVIDTSKIASGDDSEHAEVVAGGAMGITESVVEITGTVHSGGQMTIEHSDVEAKAPDAKYDTSPYRVYSNTGIELIREANGEVREGDIDGEKVFYVDTDDNDGREVNLEADGEPGYYKCKGEALKRAMTPKTGDDTNPFVPMVAGIASAATAWFASRRRETA